MLLVQIKPKRKTADKPDARPLTQAELLAEAAYTELENLRSLEAHLAAEEEFKKKAAVNRSKYSGPLIRFRSKRINDEAVVRVVVISFGCNHIARMSCFVFLVECCFMHGNDGLEEVVMLTMLTQN